MIRRNRYNYWSHSKLADFIRRISGLSKPKSATMEQWSDWEDQSIATNKVAFWVVETLFDNLQNIVCYPGDVMHAIRVYYRNRFCDKIHYLKTGLTPGEWYEFDQRLLHGMFGALVDFVESECGYSWGAKTKPSLWQKVVSYTTWTSITNKQQGIAELKDNIAVGNECPEQRATYQKIFDLYMWWTIERPNRPDPYDVADYQLPKYDKKLSFSKMWKQFDNKDRKQKMEIVSRVERQYDEEDTQKMIELIEIRHSIWT